ncbi:MAG: YceI family protein [Methylophaga sp.]|uniref:YceI family protein n=2 Tax=unclassified Methylophaga TaxID=2629249 RepID=UPI00299E888F|nr:YceI family protein [Methylophaga sp.]MDX1749360.1 YceI family protein [Methylophaga sp.]
MQRCVACLIFKTNRSYYEKTIFALAMSTVFTLPAHAADYVIDTQKAHAFIDFRIQHLGFSWMSGRFNDFEGTFSYDPENPEASEIDVKIDVASVDTNFAERDKHLREQFLETAQYPDARFTSTSFEQLEDGTLLMKGDFTLHGVTKPMTIPVEKVGEGDDPWGGYRVGFYGETSFIIEDYDIDVSKLGPSSQEVFLILSIEGIRQ